MRHGGIYVKAVIPKGAADLDGRIQKGKKSLNVFVETCFCIPILVSWLKPLCLSVSCLGDRVVAVNGRSLEGATHQQAVEVLRDTGQVRDQVQHQRSPL